MIPSISNNPTYVYASEDDGPVAYGAADEVASDPTIELALRLMDSDFERGEQDRARIETARANQSRAMDAQVAALREAAEHMLIGAAVQGSFGIASGTCAFVAAAIGPAPADPKHPTQQDVIAKNTAEKWSAVATGFSNTAAPVGKLFGDSPAGDDQADAQQARNDAERAGWVADDARSHRERTQRNVDRTQDFASNMIQGEEQTNTAILGNI